MSNRRKIRKTHPAAMRNEWFGVIHIAPGIVHALAAGLPAAEVRRYVNLTLRPVFDRHYEAGWPQYGPVPYVSVYATTWQGRPLNIELQTWPGERTEVSLTAETPAQRRARMPGSQVVSS